MHRVERISQLTTTAFIIAALVVGSDHVLAVVPPGALGSSQDVDSTRPAASISAPTTTGRDNFANVVNARDDFGAKGDWNGKSGTDDTAAALAAAAAASSSPIVTGSSFGKGTTLFFPRGVYRLTQELALGEGVCLVGAGRSSTVLVIDHPDAATDGVSWKSKTQYGRAGCLRDLTISASAKNRVRDVVSLVNWGHFEIANATILGGGRYGLFAPDGIHITVRDSVIGSSTLAGAWVGDTVGSVATTYSFRQVYFSNNSDGPGADVAGLQISFESCIFESNGEATRSAGHGIRVRSGTASLLAPYFENNAGWMGIFGTDGDTQLTVINPTLMTGPWSPKDKGAFLFDRVTSGALIGGSFAAMGPHSIKFTAASKNVSVVGVKIGPNVPEYDSEHGKSVSQYPGLVNYENPSTGNRVVSGTIDELAVRGRVTVGASSGSGATQTSGATIQSGAFDPERKVTAPIGSLFLRTDGGAGTTLYVKERGAGTTGWVPK